MSEPMENQNNSKFSQAISVELFPKFQIFRKICFFLRIHVFNTHFRFYEPIQDMVDAVT